MVRLALKIFCRNLHVRNRERLKTPGPLLLIANHPNSFLDAIIIGSLFNEPVHFLARGDAFNKPRHKVVLGMLNMIPVYRLSEGKENLSLNDAAFKRSKEILEQNGIVLIFIEGICVHKHELQPFKKGAARIALESKTLTSFRIMPIGIAYNSFERFGKSVNIIIGSAKNITMLLPYEEATKSTRHFNTVLREEIERRIEIPKTTHKRNSYILFIPATIGFILHISLYAILKKVIRKKTTGTVFFDSVLFGALLLLYPLYLLLVTTLFWWLQLPPILIFVALIIHPLTAWCAVQKRNYRD